eukprot:3933238-Rhodomonas_salina.4
MDQVGGGLMDGQARNRSMDQKLHPMVVAMRPQDVWRRDIDTSRNTQTSIGENARAPTCEIRHEKPPFQYNLYQ